MKSRREVAESLLGEINWRDDSSGFCQCPGHQHHTSANGKRDCLLRLDGAPTLTCVHSSCRDEVEAANLNLRREIGRAEREGSSLPRYRPTAEDLKRQHEQQAAEALRARAAKSAPGLLAKFAVKPADLWASSPTSLVGVTDADLWRSLLLLFRPDDVLWIGDLRDTGQPSHASHFRTRDEWLKCPTCPGPRIVPNTFKPGSFSRSAENIAERRFLVVENDKLSAPQQCAVIQFVREFTRLRAVIHSGNRSLHAWYDVPVAAHERQLAAILPQLGVDPAGFRPAQPFRMPGVKRENSERWSDLLFLDLEGGR